MGKKRSSSQIEKLPTTAPKDDHAPTLALSLKDNEKPLSEHPEEDKDEDDSSASSSSEAGEAEEEDDDEEDDSPSKNTTPSANPKTEDDSDSGDEKTDSDSEEEPAPKLKSLNSNSKPLLPIKSKAEAKPSSAPARSVTKRPVDNDPKQGKKRKITVLAAAAEKAPEEDNKKSGDDSKKLFQRVFNEDDEMAIMKGLYDFITKTGNDPFKYHTAFYDFVKKSIHFKVTLEQLRDKIRRLKLKYETKVKSGKTSNFPKENDRIMFEFGQKIWSGKLNLNEAEEKGKPNGKLSKREPAAKKPRTTTKKLVLEPDSPQVVKETGKVERTDRENPGPSLALNELFRFDESISASRNPVAAMERGMELAEESEKEELKRRWEKVQIAELEVFKMRADLAVDQAILILEALKSSSSD